MANDSETVKIRMLRVTGKDKDTQWFEYRPNFMGEVVRLSWELDTMDVELDTPVADYLLRAGYAAPIPEGSAAPAPPLPAPKPPAAPEPVPAPVEELSPPPSTPSWLKPSGDG